MARSRLTERLHTAIAKQDLGTIRTVIKEGADVNGADRHGQTPVLRAIQGGNIEFVRFLLDAGADVNAVGADAYSPLMEAANLLAPDITRLLIERGAEINARSAIGATALIYAVFAQCENFIDPEPGDVVSILLAAGADVSLRDNEGKSALDLATERNSHALVGLLARWPNQ